VSSEVFSPIWGPVSSGPGFAFTSGNGSVSASSDGAVSIFGAGKPSDPAGEWSTSSPAEDAGNGFEYASLVHPHFPTASDHSRWVFEIVSTSGSLSLQCQRGLLVFLTPLI
jgi:hypothetical protein